jgi:hypothetical protein
MKTKRQCRKLYRRLLIASGHRSYRSANRRRGELIDKNIHSPITLTQQERIECGRLRDLVDAAIACGCFDEIRERNAALDRLERLVANGQERT